MSRIARTQSATVQRERAAGLDTNPDLDGTVDLTVRKAKRLIDEQGDRIFG